MATLLICGIAVNALIVAGSSLTNYNFITFGSKTCPHCKNLHDFFSKNYQGRYCFFWVEDSDGSRLFYELYTVEINHGLSQGYAYAVPQTLVLRDGAPIAVVIGEVTDVGFWNQLVSSDVTGEIPIYLGSNKHNVVLPNESLAKLLSDLEKAVQTQTSQTPQPNNNASLSLIGLGLVIVGIAALVLYVVKRVTS